MGRPKGPGAVLPAKPAYTFGSRCSSPSFADEVPGPGAYAPRLTSSNFSSIKGTGFGTSGRLAPYGNDNPGPSEYEPRDRLMRSTSPSYTIHGTTPKDYKVANPAPGHYNPERCTEAISRHSSAPAVTMSQRLSPPKSHGRQPAPGEYEVFSPYLKMTKGMAVSMKLRHEQTIHRASVALGPGEYKLPSSLGGRASTIATRLTPSGHRQQQQMPGPSEYEVFDSTIGVMGKWNK